MPFFCGKTYSVISIVSSSIYKLGAINNRVINVDDNEIRNFVWHEKWLRPEQEFVLKFKIGDRVRVKPISELKKLFKKNAVPDSMGWYYTYKLSDGSNRRIYFTLNMKDACEEVAKVASIGDAERYTLEFEHNVFSENQDYDFIEDWLEPFDNPICVSPIYVSSFDGEEESKSERLKAILDQIEQLAAEARKIVEG